MASQITSLTIVYLSVYSGADKKKHRSSASLASVLVIHRWPVNSPHKGPANRKMFPFDDVIMSRFAPSQWETALLWLGASLESQPCMLFHHRHIFDVLLAHFLSKFTENAILWRHCRILFNLSLFSSIIHHIHIKWKMISEAKGKMMKHLNVLLNVEFIICYVWLL